MATIKKRQKYNFKKQPAELEKRKEKAINDYYQYKGYINSLMDAGMKKKDLQKEFYALNKLREKAICTPGQSLLVKKSEKGDFQELLEKVEEAFIEKGISESVLSARVENLARAIVFASLKKIYAKSGKKDVERLRIFLLQDLELLRKKAGMKKAERALIYTGQPCNPTKGYNLQGEKNSTYQKMTATQRTWRASSFLYASENFSDSYDIVHDTIKNIFLIVEACKSENGTLEKGFLTKDIKIEKNRKSQTTFYDYVKKEKSKNHEPTFESVKPIQYLIRGVSRYIKNQKKSYYESQKYVFIDALDSKGITSLENEVSHLKVKKDGLLADITKKDLEKITLFYQSLSFTPTQEKILSYLLDGLSYAEIGSILGGISKQAVHKHVAKINKIIEKKVGKKFSIQDITSKNMKLASTEKSESVSLKKQKIHEKADDIYMLYIQKVKGRPSIKDYEEAKKRYNYFIEKEYKKNLLPLDNIPLKF